MTMRVHDLAAEFGMTSDDLMNLLRVMEIFVRSHMSALEEAKVARVRTRIERDKRAAKEPARPARAGARAGGREAPAPPPPRRRSRRAGSRSCRRGGRRSLRRRTYPAGGVADRKSTRLN